MKKIINLQVGGFISKSSQETKDIAAKFASKLNGGSTISLSGNLGGGKTTFVQGLARGLGIKEKITSPTFVIIKEYPTIKNFSLVHIDLYRINNFSEAKSAGIEDYLGKPDQVCVIEWGERIKEHLPKNTKLIKFKFIDENTREIKGEL